MVIKRNTEPKNKDFFTRVVPFIPWIFWGGVIFQIISAITEAFGVYQFGSAIGAPIYVTVFFTLMIVIGWELLIRSSVEYLVKTGVKKARKEIILEKPEYLMLLIALCIAGPLIYYSYSVSKENAHMTFEVMMPDRDTVALASIVSEKKSNLTAIDATYDKRKEDIEARFNEQEKAAKGVYLAARTKHNTNIEDWKAKEKKYNKKYPTYIKNEKDAINDAYAKYKSEANEITKAKSEELASLDRWREGRETGTIALAGDGLNEEGKKRNTFVKWYEKYSFIWSHFAGITAILAVLCVIFAVVFKVLAGIEEETHLTPESLDPGLMNEVAYLLQLKITSPIRNMVRTAINKTASKRVDLEIVTPSTISVTPERYSPPSVTGSARTVTNPLRSTPVTHIKSVTESVTEKRYAEAAEKPLSPLPTHITGVTGEIVTHYKGGALPKSETVTKSEAITVELEPTVTGTKPKKEEKTVTDAPGQIIMVGPTKAVIINPQNGKRETISYEKVGSRKRGNYGNVKNRKSKAAQQRCKELGDFYADLESKMKEAK